MDIKARREIVKPYRWYCDFGKGRPAAIIDSEGYTVAKGLTNQAASALVLAHNSALREAVAAATGGLVQHLETT